MPKWGTLFNNSRTRKEKRIFIRPFIRYTNMEYKLSILFKEIQQELLGKVNENSKGINSF